MTDMPYHRKYLEHIWPDTYKRHTQFSEKLNELLDRQMSLLATMGVADDDARARCYQIIQLLYSISSALHTLRQQAELLAAPPGHPPAHVHLKISSEPLREAAARLETGSHQLTELLYELNRQMNDSQELLSPRIMEAAGEHLRMLDQHAHAAGELGEMLRHHAEQIEEADRAISCMMESPSSASTPPPVMDALHISAVSPRRVIPGEYGLLDVVLYEEDCREAVERILVEYGSAREHLGGVHSAQKGMEISVVLSSPDVTIAAPEQKQLWHGRYLRFSFDYLVPEDFSRRSILLRAAVYIGGIPATRLSIRIDCDAPGGTLPSVQRLDVKSAFMSYSCEDRYDVLRIVQGIQQVRPDLKVFIDVDSLRSGENWKERLLQEIDSSDVLYLCWSEAASKSANVEMEWRYAYRQKGPEGIETLALCPAEICPPPQELRDMHFGSRLLYILRFCK